MAKNEILFEGGIPVSDEYVITMTKGIVIEDEKIDIVFDYPLSTPATLSFKKKGGFTLAKLIECVRKGYEKIYAEEDEDVGPTGNLTGMMNRARSEGRYGIWGHSIEDLAIETIYYNKDKKLITLSIGS